MKLAKKFITSNYTIYSLGILFVFLLWLVLSITMGKGTLLFPYPGEVFARTGIFLTEPYTWLSIGWTLFRTFIGFIFALLVALVLGIIAGNIKYVYTFLTPLVTILKSIPTAAFVFLFLVLSGSKYAPIYIVFLLSFPILYEAFVGGFKNIPNDISDALKIDSSNRMYGLVMVKLPMAIPYIMVGFSSSFALSLKTTIMAEIITGDTDYGLGCAISAYRKLDPSDLTPVFAYSLIAITFILLIDLINLFITHHFKKD